MLAGGDRGMAEPVPENLGESLQVVILTLNEAARLAGCVASVPPGVLIHVLDGGSTDGTVPPLNPSWRRR